MKDIRLGIIGGGQLGKMMAQVAQRMGLSVWVLDPYEACPASFVADHTIVGSFQDEKAIRDLASHCTVTTYDIEHISTEAIKKIEQEGHQFAPSPELLALIQDKGLQKDFLSRKGIPMPRFQLMDEIKREEIQRFGLPCVQKTRKGGYDGRGVHVIRGDKDFERAFPKDFLLEELVSIEKELGIMVARNREGSVVTYPLTEMVFDERANICDMVIAPARVPKEVEKQAQQIAIACVEALQGVGIFGVELFLSTDGRILYNEIAPRPHNSGHYTIEACETSQFEQHIRAVLNLPLGSPRLVSPAVMFNLLGEPGHEGSPIIEGFEEALSVPGLAFHFYRKPTTKPFRKMGHITITAPTLEEALDRAMSIRQKIRILSEDV
ncbi:MAG: 5-(carboxyamino)imidazole ribonucleotide synthase [Brevinematales bacterium]|nr:5-(carboxyamino)imidazole ribonucleotide synthase [Brevinematales bacterium]